MIELANSLCSSQPRGMRSQVAERLRGTKYNAERGLLCTDSQPDHGRPFGLSPVANETLDHAPLLFLDSPKVETARLGEALNPAQRLRTHQLWPTLVSIATLTPATANESAVREDTAFLRRLNKAARTAYHEYHRGGPNDEFPPCKGELGCDDNTQFFHWQYGFLPLYVKQKQPQTQRVPLAAEDLDRLQQIAIDACLAHVLAHRRPATLDDLGFPTPSRFQLWVSVLGGQHAMNIGHGPHAHTNSVCSGTFYSKAPERGAAAPLVFSDPRGAWRSLSQSASVLAAELGEDGLRNRLPTQPQAPFHHQYSFAPTAGELVLFPSWLVHHVEPQEGGERIAWSFNVVADTFMDAWAWTAV